MSILHQREDQKNDYRESHGRHRGGYVDLWSQESERQHEEGRENGRHRAEESALDRRSERRPDDDRRLFEVAYRRLHGGL